MKKFVKLVLINLILIVLAFFVFEQIAFYVAVQGKKEHAKVFDVDKSKLKPFWCNKMIDFEDLYNSSEKNSFRKPVGVEYSKKPIVLFGCSFTQGYRLKSNQTFDYYLSKYSKRPIYNRAHNAWGPQHMLYQLSRNDFYKEVPEPEYLIYVFLKHQVHMFYDYTFQPWDNDIYLRYEEKQGKLVKVKNPPKFIQGSYLLKVYHRQIADSRYDCNFNKKDEQIMLLHMISAKKEAQKHWKNTKFVFVFFDLDNEDSDFKIQLTEDLKNNGFEVVNTSDIAEDSYENEKFHISKDDPHPNENFWKNFVPKFVKSLNL